MTIDILNEKLEKSGWGIFNPIKYENNIFVFLGGEENIQPEIDKNIDNQSSLVSSGNASEDESLKAARQTYVDSLEGTESVGYTEDKQ